MYFCRNQRKYCRIKTRVFCFFCPLLDGDTGSLLSLSEVVQERLWASADQVGLRGEVLHGEAGKCSHGSDGIDQHQQ